MANWANPFSQAVMVRMKYRLTMPQNKPNNMLAGTLSSPHTLSTWKEKSDSPPMKMYEKHVAVTHDIRMGSSEAMDRSTISTSSVNTSPAMGALNMPAMAAAAPQPTNSIRLFFSTWNSCPRLLPMADPVSTMGASAPTEPPKPMVMADAMTEDQQLCDLR